MSLPKNYLIDATIERLGSSFIDLYDSKIGDDVREYLFLLFYQEFIEPDTGSQRNLKEVHSYYYKNKFRKTKRNWYNSLKKSVEGVAENPKKITAKNPKELLGEIKYLQDGVDKGFLTLESLYNVDSMKDLIDLRLKEVEEWVVDDSKLLSEYRYIQDKTTLQVQNALKFDSIIAVTKMVIDHYGGEFSAIVKEVSDVVSEFPLPGKNGTSNFKAVKDQEEVIEADHYEIADVSVTTLITNELLENKKKISLNQKDYDILNYVMAKRGMDFIENQKIYVNIRNIVKNVYSTTGQKAYAQIRERIEKLKNISFDIKDENGKRYLFDLFDQVVYLDDEETRVEIKINEFLQQRYIDNHVTKIYSDKIKNFTLDISENMVFILQKERFSKMLNRGDEEVSFPYPYEFFIRRIRFPSRSKEKNMKLIEESLKEVKEGNVTVNYFKRAHDVFHVTYYPVSSHEAEDLIEYNGSNNISAIVQE